MKDKVKPFLYVFLIINLILANFHQLSGQEKVNISAGFGLPTDLINLGFRFQLDQAQIGLSVGSMPLGSNDKIFCVSGDYNYHFGGFSKFSNRRPWYGRFGLAHLKYETENYIDKDLYLNMRLGRDFNISDKFGIILEFGPVFVLSSQTIHKEPNSSSSSFGAPPVLLNIGIGFFYRI